MNLKKLALNGMVALAIYQADGAACLHKVIDVEDDFAIPIMSEYVGVRDSFQSPEWESVTIKDSATLVINLAIVASDKIAPSDVASRGLNPVALPIQTERVAISDTSTSLLSTLIQSSSDKVATSDRSIPEIHPLLISTQDTIAISDTPDPRISPLIISASESIDASDTNRPNPTPRFSQSIRSSANPLTLSITINTGDTLIVLGIVTGTSTIRTGSPPTPTRGAQTFSQVGSAVSGTTECVAELWYLINPTVGTDNISIPNSGGIGLRALVTTWAATYVEFSQYVSTNLDSFTPTLTLSNVLKDSIVVDIFAGGKATVSTPSDILLGTNDEGAWSSQSQYQIQSSIGAQTFTWTAGSPADDVAFIMVAFNTTQYEFISSDLSTISDVPTLELIPLVLPVQDSISVSDIGELGTTLVISVSEGVVVSELGASILNLAISVSDAITTFDLGTPDSLPWLIVEASDNVEASESFESVRLSNLEASSQDSVSLSDVANITANDLDIFITAPLELVTNGDMELDDSSWVTINTPAIQERSDVQKHGDSFSRYVVDSTPSAGGITQTVSKEAGKTYRFSTWYYIVSGTLYIGITNGNKSAVLSGATYSETGSWKYITTDVVETITGNTGWINIQNPSSATSAEFYIDDVSLKEVTPFDDIIILSDRAIVEIGELNTSNQDSIATSDRATVLINPFEVSLVDSIESSDLGTPELILHPEVIVPDSIEVSDVLTVELITPLEVTAQDDIELSDVIDDISTGIANDLDILQTEWTAVSDLYELYLDPIEVTVVDTITTSDKSNFEFEAPLILDTPVDLVELSDVATVELFNPLEVSVLDSIAISDVVSSPRLTLLVSVPDSISISDFTALEINPILIVNSDNIIAEDEQSKGPGWAVVIDPILIVSAPDFTSLSDQATVPISPLNIAKQDLVTISDTSAIQLPSLAVFTSDTVSISDSTLEFTLDTYLGPITDSISIFDYTDDVEVQVHLDLEIVASDYIGLLDTFDNPEWEQVTVSDVPTVEVITPGDEHGYDYIAVSDVSSIQLVTTGELTLTISVQDDISISDYLKPPDPIPTDYATVSDSSIITMGIAGTLFISTPIERVAVSDARIAQLDLLVISARDTITPSDYATSEAGDLNLVHSDELTLSDAREGRLNPIVVTNQEDIAISESSNLLLKPLAIVFTDNIEASDLDTLLLNLIVISNQDSVTVSDPSTIERGTPVDYDIPVLDTATLSDSFTIEIDPLLIEAVDTIETSDSAILLTGITFDYEIPVLDFVEVSDTATIEIDHLLVSGVDSIAVSDQSSILNNPLIVITTDTVALSDLATLEIDPLEVSGADTISTSDAIFSVVTVAAEIMEVPIATDLVDVSDVAIVEINTLLVSVPDSISISDSKDLNLDLLVSATDSLTISDTREANLGLLVSVSDAISISDIRELVLDLRVSVSDSISVSDTKSFDLAFLYISKIDYISVKDTSSVLGDILYVSASDTITSSDINQPSIVGQMAQEDYVSVSDFAYLRVIKQTLNWGEMDASQPNYSEVDANGVLWLEIDP